jgi:Zn-dependent protease
VGSSIPLGRFFGVFVRFDVTLLLLAAFFVLRGFESGGAQGALNQLTFVVLLFVCVFLHECGHAAAAYVFGIRTLDVTLHFFGGYARLSRAPQRPFDDAVISFAGPAVNLVIAGLLYLWLQQLEGDFAALKTYSLVYMLWYANLFLALFNLLPGYPLDGGNITRAILSYFMPNARARIIVAYIGAVIGFGLIAWGFPDSIFTMIFGGLFIYMATMEIQNAKRWM